MKKMFMIFRSPAPGAGGGVNAPMSAAKDQPPEKEKAVQDKEAEKAQAEGAKQSALAHQTELQAGAALSARSLSTSIQQWTKDDPAFGDEHTEKASKSLSKAADSFIAAAETELQPGSGGISIAPGLSKRQRLGVVIAQIDQINQSLKDNAKAAGKTGDSGEGVGLLEDAKASLEKSLEPKGERKAEKA